MEPRPNIKETPTLLVTVLRQFSRLVQDELALARAEVSNNVSRAAVGLALLAVAGILLLVALNVLAGALVGYLATTGLTAGTAALIVGGGLLLVALILFFVGKGRLDADALQPTRTTRNLKRDIEALKETGNA